MNDKITMKKGILVTPDHPVIPFIEGDGTGKDIWRVARKVMDSAVERAYGSTKSIQWKEVLAGEKAFNEKGTWLPKETLEAFKEYLVGIKGPLTTPVGKGFRSLNVTLRQELDLFVCLRPVRYYPGVPSPVKTPQLIDMAVFRENTEDVYAGMETEEGSEETKRIASFLSEELGWKLNDDTALGIKPISKGVSERLIRAAIKYAIDHNRKSVTLVHKGNIMKYTEGAFRSWGYELAAREFPNDTVSWKECGGDPPAGKILIKDTIADAFLQQILTRPNEFDVIATMNLNGDYISDALAAQVGGIGIAPGANINYQNGIAIFEATHGTAPKYAGQNKVNPGSVILSGRMMFEYIGWREAAQRIDLGMERAIAGDRLTYDFARLRDGAETVTSSEFGDEIIRGMD